MGISKFSILAAIVLSIAAPGAPAVGQSLFDQGKSFLKGIDPGTMGDGAQSLSQAEIAGGLRDALRAGTKRVVDQLGDTGGFYNTPDVHIPLPPSLQRVQSILSRAGMGGMGEELELRLNRAAETAVPKARALFGDAISEMTIDDARSILNGPKDSATQYFRQKMGSPLAREMRPIVNEQLADVGAVASYERMMGRYREIPFVPDVRADLTDHVLEKAIDGVFLYLGREEAAIRENPARRTTELMRKVFGG